MSDTDDMEEDDFGLNEEPDGQNEPEGEGEQKDKKQKDAMAVFETMSVPRAVFKLAIPAMIAVLFTVIYNIADTIFIGLVDVDTAAQSNAVGLCTSLFMIFTTLGTLFGMGGSSLISRKMGTGKEEDRQYVKKVSSFCFWIGLACGVVVMIIYLSAMDPLIRMLAGSTLDEEPTLYGYMRDYLIMISIAGIFAVVPSSFANIIRCEGKSTAAAAGMLGGNILNIILDPVFILACDMGTMGAGLATLISMFCACAYYVIYFFVTKSMLSISPKDFSGRNKITSQVLAVGIPAALGSLMITVSTIIMLNMMGNDSMASQTGMSYALKIVMIATLMAGGIGQGVQSMLGYCLGAGMKERFNKTLWFSLGFAFIFCIVLGLICGIWAQPIASIFLIGESDASVVEEFTGCAEIYARIMLYTSPLVGVFYVCQNTLLAMGSVVRSLIVNISRQGFILIPVLFIATAIAPDSPEAIAYSQVISDGIAVVLAIILLVTMMNSVGNKAQRVLAERDAKGAEGGDETEEDAPEPDEPDPAENEVSFGRDDVFGNAFLRGAPGLAAA